MYSFTQSYKFPIAKRTADLGYNYYVDKDFQKKVVTKNPKKFQEVMHLWDF